MIDTEPQGVYGAAGEQIVPSDDIPRIDEIGAYVTVARAAMVSGFNDRWIRRLCARGDVRCVRLDGGKQSTILVHRRSLERYMKRHGRTKTTEEEKHTDDG